MNTVEISEDARLNAVRVMQEIGGGFAQAIATAFSRADPANRERLVFAFPELFERYAALAAEQADRAMLEDKRRDGYARRQQAQALQLQQRQDAVEQYLNRNSHHNF